MAHLSHSSPSPQSIWAQYACFSEITHGLPYQSLSFTPCLEYVHQRGSSTHSMPKVLSHHNWPSFVPSTVCGHKNLLISIWLCCLGFFCFLWCREFTCQLSKAYSFFLLSPTDICVNSHTHPHYEDAHNLQTETGMITWYLGRTGETLCTVQQSTKDGLWSLHHNCVTGNTGSRIQYFLVNYCSCRFRIGPATI